MTFLKSQTNTFFPLSFSDMTAFTPPAHDAWVIRYPRRESKQSIEEVNKIKKPPKVPAANQLEQSCKSYIETSEIPIKSSKSLGTDDFFRDMACSKNLLKVCEKLMTNKDPSKETSITSMSENDDEFDAELSLMDEKGRMDFYRNKYGNHRSSQSLPASPKLDRKTSKTEKYPEHHNPYFTISKPYETRQENSISFLTNLFGITAKKPSEAQASLAQKQNSESAFDITEKKTNVSSFNSGEASTSQVESDKSKIMQPRPHKYREMNFWSPTSM